MKALMTFAAIVIIGCMALVFYSASSRPPAGDFAADLDAAIEMGVEGDLLAARQALERLVETYPQEPAAWMNYGVVLSGSGDHDRARKAFNEVQRLDPSAWSAQAEVATIALIEGDMEEALDLMEAIPAGEGRVAERLRVDPLWNRLENPRVRLLRIKHDLIPETSQRIDDVTVRP